MLTSQIPGTLANKGIVLYLRKGYFFCTAKKGSLEKLLFISGVELIRLTRNSTENQRAISDSGITDLVAAESDSFFKCYVQLRTPHYKSSFTQTFTLEEFPYLVPHSSLLTKSS
jgi:hypothetical protein